ncbi:MAG TPA: hypothetical protein P5523_09470 [Bacteroidales bacterium]|nr:hypothetical protein [Bacteroidales bacterium]
MVNFNAVGCRLDNPEKIADTLEKVFAIIVRIVRENKNSRDLPEIKKQIANILRLLATNLYYQDLRGMEREADEFVNSKIQDVYL